MLPGRSWGLAGLLCIAAPAWTQTCTFTLNPAAVSAPAAESTATIQVTASASTCVRNVQTAAPWITISFGQSGTGNGTVGLRFQPNRDPFSRSGSVTIGTAALPVTQVAATCSFVLSPSDATVPFSGGSGSFSIDTTCNWTAVPDVPWISITSATSGTGDGRVNFTVSANNTTSTRSGTIRVGTAVFRVSQPAPPCTVSLSPAQASLPASGGTGSMNVTSGCSWTAAPSVPWIQITGGANGSGDGVVSFTVTPNPQVQSRTGTITVGGQTFTVSQAGALCAITLSPSEARFAADGGVGSIGVTASCSWTSTTGESWITVSSGASGTGNGTLNFQVARNTGAARSGTILVGTVTFPVQQSGTGCPVTLSPSSAAVAPAGGTGIVLVSTANDCSWGASTTAAWITLDPVQGTGNGVLRWRAAANRGVAARAAQVSVGSGSFTLTQAAAIPSFTSAAVVNAASFQPGPVAPGTIITVFGSDLGPEDLATAQLIPDGSGLTKALAGTQVLFDDVAAPMVYVRHDLLACVVPFAVAGRTITRMQVVRGEARSSVVPVPVAPASPGLFSLNASGAGPGAILNQDLSLNSADNAAARGSVVLLFATGGGVLDPSVPDGVLGGAVLSKPTLPVTAEIGGQPATVLYAGTASGLVAGALQVNLLVSEAAPTGPDVPVRLQIGTYLSQEGVTLAVR